MGPFPVIRKISSRKQVAETHPWYQYRSQKKERSHLPIRRIYVLKLLGLFFRIVLKPDFTFSISRKESSSPGFKNVLLESLWL